MKHARWLVGILLWALLLSGQGCETGAPAKPYDRDGKVYGVTKGLFRGRWWNYYERGLSFAEGRFWKEAEEDLREALGQRDKDQRRARTYGMHFVDYFPHRELGAVLFHQGRYQEAIGELESSLKSVKSAKAEFYLDRARKAWIELQDKDVRPPEISLQSQGQGDLTNGFQVTVEGVVRDDTYVKEVQVNGVGVRIDLAAPEVPFRVTLPLKAGENSILILATDLTGKNSLERREIQVDRQGPVINIDEPIDGSPRPERGLRLRGYAYDDSGLQGVRVNGHEILAGPVSEAVLDHPISMAPGEDLVVEAWDRAGNQTRAEIHLREKLSSAGAEPVRSTARFVASMETPPHALLVNKGKGTDTAAPIIELKGWTDEQTVFLDQAYLEGNARDEGQVQALKVNGQQILRRPGRNVYFSHLAGLTKGDNRFTIEGEDQAGNRTEKRLHINRKLQKIREIGSRMAVALLPFERKGGPGLIEEAFEETLLGSVIERGRFDMVERQRLEEVLREQRLSRTDLADQDAAIRVGKILAATGVLMGSVVEKEGSLEIFARMVETETSLVITAVDVYGEDVDPQGLRQLCGGLALKLCDELPLAEGLVVQVKGARMILDLGKEKGIKKGMRLIVFQEGEPIKHPVTGKVLGADVEELGHGRVQTVQEQMSFAEILEEEALGRIHPMHTVITQ